MLKSKRLGDAAEDKLVEYLTSIGFTCSKVDYSDRYKYDIAAHSDNDWISFEVKNDVMSARTGNAAIEYWNSKKNAPSGLYVTSAVFWIHMLQGEMLYSLTSDLLEWTKKNKPDRIISAGGDDNADLMLYSVEKIQEILKPIDGVTKDELMRIYMNSAISKAGG